MEHLSEGEKRYNLTREQKDQPFQSAMLNFPE